MFFKSCPKCRGDMYLAEDTHGRFRECLQCGYLIDIDTGERELATAARSRAAA